MIFKFYFSFVIKLADIVSKNIPNVCWESKKGNSLHIPVDGVPYLHVNTRQCNYYQGKDKIVKIKENHRAKNLILLKYTASHIENQKKNLRRRILTLKLKNQNQWDS